MELLLILIALFILPRFIGANTKHSLKAFRISTQKGRQTGEIDASLPTFLYHLSGFLCTCVFCRRYFRCLTTRQPHGENGTDAGRTFDMDFSAVQHGDMFNNGKS